MSIKKYGIYLAYPSYSGLRPKEELHLITFLKNAVAQQQMHFVIACPSWSAEPLKRLLKSHFIPTTQFEFVHSSKMPIVCFIIERLQKILSSPRIERLIQSHLHHHGVAKQSTLLETYLSCRTWKTFLMVSFLYCVLIPIICFSSFIKKIMQYLFNIAISHTKTLKHKMRQIEPKFNRLYSYIITSETRLLNKKLSAREDIHKWIIPSSCWADTEHFKKGIIVLFDEYVYSSYPVDSTANVQPLLKLDKLLKNAQHIIIHHHKVNFLLKAHENKIVYIQPPVSNLKQLIDVNGFADNNTATQNLCRIMLHRASYKNLLANYTTHHSTDELDYIFFTSSSHCEGNVLNILKAYKDIIEKLPLTNKLIIHQDNTDYANALDFIKEHGLFQHVMWLHNLSDQELAACYKLCRFVINPSAEFDVRNFFSQSLLFEKPVIFSENLEAQMLLKGEPELSSICLFDPYDYMDISKKMQWALEKTETLYQMQTKIAAKFKSRTADEFLIEYLDVLEGKQHHLPAVTQEIEYATN